LSNLRRKTDPFLAKLSALTLSDRTITKKDIVDSAFDRCRHLPRQELKRLFEEAIAEIINELANGESVKLKGLGIFSVRSKSARLGRNPKTGEPALITKRRVVTFKASDVLKAKMAPSDSAPAGWEESATVQNAE
jgi:integration host factor subunit alpha